MEPCTDKEYCKFRDEFRAVDWSNEESLHNLIEQLGLYCGEDYLIGLIGALFLAGIVVGCSTLTRLGDVYGRKPVYLLGMVMHLGVTISLLMVTSPMVSYFILFIFGASITARYYVGYTYNLEMQPKSSTVMVSTTMFLFESMVYFFICIYFRYLGKDWKPL